MTRFPTGPRCLATAAVLTCMFAAAVPLHAQVVDTAVTPQRSQLVRVAKWTTLSVSTGAAVYGFFKNRQADDGYGELEAMCEADRANCVRRSNGAYEDAELERRYQDVIALDSRARNALLASQIGIATSVILFVYDLRAASPPRDIPYEPRTLDVVPARGGGVGLRLSLPVGNLH